MQNYSSIFQEVLAEFESNYVPGDQGDAGKGQVTVRAGLRIFQNQDSDIGYIAKTSGQTNFHGVSVDALQDKSDGTGADFLTDELQSDGRRLIKLAYSVYPAPPPGIDPKKGWVQPEERYLSYPGPMKLRVPIPPEPIPPQPAPIEPMPPMPTVWSTQPFRSIGWYDEMSPALDAIYCNLFTRPGHPLRHADFGGWGNWIWHIVEMGESVAQVVEEMKQSDEYHSVHPGG